MELVDICNKAGLPPGVINLLSGDPAYISDKLLSSSIIKKVSITGSTRVGKLILKKAAEKVQRVTMELSGHSPFIVFNDVDLEKVTDMAIFLNLEIMDKFVFHPVDFIFMKVKKMILPSLMINKIKKLKIGDGMDKDTILGPLTTKKD